ncbi:glycosyltransferase [uncultured Jatrophihabitans sp.]|uniref:glycosyltransferase n=1 Tax=uncultured Jatrophihabitans sp. TaxID=1610747 RepID=UPI0035CAB84B
MPSRRIALIGPSRAPVAQPFAGGLTAHLWSLCSKLLERGHDVTLFAPAGSDPRLPVHELRLGELRLSQDSRSDVSMPPEVMMVEHHAYLSLMLELASGTSGFDVLHNHSLHYLPLAMSSTAAAPMLTTLHTPPTPWLESAVQSAPSMPSRFAAVSAHTAHRWAPLLGRVDVISNGIDLQAWPQGPGGAGAVWTGRIVAEKAPHLAVHAARKAGLPITLAGPIDDPDYFDAEVRPLLGGEVDYAGHLTQHMLSLLVSHSCVAVVTPVWDEPYGLVVAEALASGTPVAAFGRGGIPDVVDATCARLVADDDVGALAQAMDDAAHLPRAAARARAEAHCSVETMVDRYEDTFTEMLEL